MLVRLLAANSNMSSILSFIFGLSRSLDVSRLCDRKSLCPHECVSYTDPVNLLSKYFFCN